MLGDGRTRTSIPRGYPQPACMCSALSFQRGYVSGVPCHQTTFPLVQDAVSLILGYKGEEIAPRRGTR